MAEQMISRCINNNLYLKTHNSFSHKCNTLYLFLLSIKLYPHYSKTCLNRPLKAKFLMTNGSMIEVEHSAIL